MKTLMKAVLLLLCQASMAASPADVLQDKLNAMHTLRAHFSQIIEAGKRTVSESSGSMALMRPGKFLWKTKDPMAQTIIADGQHLWIYDVDLEQVTVKKQDKGIGGTAALFLSGYNDTVMRNFTVTERIEGKQVTYDLRAKSNKDSILRVMLHFKDSQLIGMELFDQLGQRTRVRLTDIHVNPSLPITMFTFKPPKGVDVVRQ